MQIYAFGHRKQVGKDTFVKFVMEILRKQHRNLNIQRVGFADKLKSACFLMYSWAGHRDPSYYEHTPGSKEQMLIPLGKTVRQVWIEVGNHMRTYDPGVWFNATLKQATCDVLFITDLRFPNEVKAVEEAGGKVIKIENSDVPYTDDDADRPLRDFNMWDEILFNDGNLQDLYNLAERWVERCQIQAVSMI